MKRSVYFIIGFIALGLLSCRKSSDNLTIKQFDANNIQQYISTNGLTGFSRDTTGGDTTGIWYKVITQGNGSVVNYQDIVSYIYTYHTFDNSYATTDTIVNHTNTYVGHITPLAVQIAIKNLLKKKGGVVRMLVPSRLAFGINGYFSGAIAINGNQCLDYTVSLVNNDLYINPTTNKPVLDTLIARYTDPGTNAHVVDTLLKKYKTNQEVYDDISIQKYMAANGLSGYTRSQSGLWYKISQAGTGTDRITIASTVGVDYTGYLFNGTIFDQQNTTDGTAAVSLGLYDLVPGFAEGLMKTTAGGKISLLIPSALAYGNNVSGAIPAFSCLRFEINVINVTN